MRKTEEQKEIKKIDYYKHQQDALDKTEADGHENAAYYHPCGSGKTITGAEQAYRYGGTILIVCQKCKIPDWTEHWATYYDLPVYDLTKPAQYKKWLEDANRTVGVITYDTLWRRDAVMQRDHLTVLCDESSLVSNEKAKRTKALIAMHNGGKIDHIVLLSGTPVDGKIERLWSQMILLGGRMKKWDYWNHYVIYHEQQFWGNMYPTKIIDGYKNIDGLKTMLGDLGAQFLTRDECLGSLPDKQIVYLDTPAPKQYREMLREGIVTIDGTELRGDSNLAKRLALRQICGAYNDKRYEQIEGVLETLEERCIIFYQFNSEKQRLIDICEKLGKTMSEVSGSRHDLDAYNNCDDAVVLCQYQAASMGLNLQKASVLIMASMQERYESHDQAICRVWRDGQTRVCTIYICRCKGTIEDSIADCLERKRDYTDQLFLQDTGAAVTAA